LPLACQCCAEGCTAAIEPNVTFDLMLTPPTADGSVAGLGGEHNVHLTLQ